MVFIVFIKVEGKIKDWFLKFNFFSIGIIED